MTVTAIKTTCESTIWRGFFGRDEDGNHDECPQEIVVDVSDVSDEEIEENWELADPIVVDDEVRVWFSPVSIRCPACDSLLEWPQRWEETDEPATTA